MNRPLALTYPDDASLEQLLKDIKFHSTGQPKLPAGIPIYVDPIGLSEADKTMTSTVKRPPPDQNLTLREHLRRVLKTLGLDFTIRDGFLMITSQEALDERSDDDPYLGFSDVLRVGRPRTTSGRRRLPDRARANLQVPRRRSREPGMRGWS